MKVYHRTYQAENILQQGFQDSRRTSGTIELWRGVWVSADYPLDIREKGQAEKVLCLDIPEVVFEEYEMREVEKPYREAMIPADELNRYPVEVWLELE